MKIIVLPCSFDNYAYLIICEKSGEAAVVDPAEFYPILCEIEALGVRLTSIYCTHHHADHIGGLEDLVAEFPGLNVYCFKEDQNRIRGCNKTLEHGDTIRVGSIDGKVLHTPGHTSGSICFLFGDNLFTGDSLFGAGCGRLFEGSPSEMFESLNTTIASLPQNTNLYFGHEYSVHNLKFSQFVEPGNTNIATRLKEAEAKRDRGEFTTPSTLQLELETNPFLRCSNDQVAESVAEKLVLEDNRPVSVFTALRRLKDSF